MSEKPWSIESLEAEHRRIALDANVLIYLTEADELRGPRARLVIDAIDSGRVMATMATIGQVEILSGPARSGDAAAFERLGAEIRSLRLELVSLSADTAEDAAWIRGQGGLEIADAVHVASARAAGATAFVTNDRRIRSRPVLEVLYLDDLVA